MRIFYYLVADRRIEICILACCPCLIKVCGKQAKVLMYILEGTERNRVRERESIMIFVIFVVAAA